MSSSKPFPPFNWLGLIAFSLTFAGVVWAGAEKLAGKASQEDVSGLGRRMQSTESVQEYLREDVKEIREDVKQILKEVRKR
jgi:hypothetical protein